MTPLIICCIKNCASESLCFCTKFSVDGNIRKLDFSSIMKTCPCNMQQFQKEEKIIIFR